MRTLKGTKTAWVDILKPSEDDIAKLKKLHKFHPVILKELLSPSARARIDDHDTYIFISFHVPVYDEHLKTSRRSEIDFLITKSAVITIHYEHLPHIDAFFAELAKDKALQKELLNTDSLLLVYNIFEAINDFALRQLRHVEERVAFVAQEIFSNNEEGLLKEISYIKRDILDYRLISQPQEKFFEELVAVGKNFWGKKSFVYLSDLRSDNVPVHANVRNYFEVIESLETTNAQLLNAQTNAIIKKFTVGAFLISIPLFFIFSLGVPYVYDIFAINGLRFWLSFIGINSLVVFAVYILRKRRII